MNDTPQTDSGERPPRRWLRWLRDLALLAVVIIAVQWWQGRDLAHGDAPPLVGHLLDGQPFQLDPSQGPFLVHFWASWCPVCRLEQGNIAAIAASYPVMTVATSSGTPAEVASFLQQQGVELPVLMDETGAIARAWGASGVPASFVINTDGSIAHAGMGYSTEYGLRFRLWLAD
jgi:peroxiredoxin